MGVQILPLAVSLNSHEGQMTVPHGGSYPPVIFYYELLFGTGIYSFSSWIPMCPGLGRIHVEEFVCSDVH